MGEILIDCYISLKRVKDLCAELNVNDETLERVAPYIDKTKLSDIAPYFTGLFSRETAPTASKSIEALCNNADGRPADDGFKILAVFIVAALRSRELYKSMGIDDKIFLKTMNFIKLVPEENKFYGGRLVFDRQYWFYRHVSLTSFKLGIFEFEIRTLESGEDAGFPGEADIPVVAVHIPAGSVMTRENLNDAYAKARAFFTKYFPGHEYKNFYCGSWLLSPALREMLGPGSKILEFQSDFRITRYESESESCVYSLFKKRSLDDLNDFPEDTSLRRAAKKRLLAGGHIGTAYGVLK